MNLNNAIMLSLGMVRSQWAKPNFDFSQLWAACADGTMLSFQQSVLQKAARWLDAYFAGENPPIDFPLAPQGSAFQREVWALLQAIPYGKTVTYGQLAKQLQARRGGAIVAAQAVGGAVGRNKIALIIPCHRVVGAHGALTGYAGGIARKAQLLQMEQAGEAGV